MEKNVIIRKVVYNESDQHASYNSSGIFNNKFGRELKKIIFAAGLAGMALFFSDCSAAYIASEPSYSYSERPAQPNNLSVWIDGEWEWDNRSQRYYLTDGYWDNPRQGQTYVPGRWQTTPKGKIWRKGYWQADE